MKKLLFCAALLLSACASTPEGEVDIEDIPLAAVEKVDLDRYMGRWYMIANIPYFAERGNLAPYVEYRRVDRLHIEDLYTALDDWDEKPFTKKGHIEVFDLPSMAEGRITFFPAPGQDYAVLYVDEDYRYTMIGHPSRDYAWLFSRQPDMPEEIYEDMLEVLEDNHFNPARVLKIPQRPSQAGQPGFQ